MKFFLRSLLSIPSITPCKGFILPPRICRLAVASYFAQGSGI